MIRDAHTNPNPEPSGCKGEIGQVDSQVAQLERTIRWLSKRREVLTESHARRVGAVAETAERIWSDVNDRIDREPGWRDRIGQPRKGSCHPSLREGGFAVGGWVLYRGRPHLIRSIRTNPLTGSVLNIRLLTEAGGERNAPFGRGLEKI